MRRSEIKIKRQDLMSAPSIATLLRKMADQLEAEHLFRFDEFPVTLANQVHVHQKFEKKGRENLYKLTLLWDEELADQTKLDDEDRDELPDENDLPPPPLDLPGPEGEQPRLSNK